MPGKRHFLLTNQVRTLSLRQVFDLTDEEAYAWFRRARWPDTEERLPWCAHCGCEGAWELSRRRFKCKQRECRREFTVTSGTIFAHHKLPFRTIIAALALVAHSVKGKAALQLSRELDIDHKSAWVLLHKVREAIAAERAEMKLSGTVEMDGMYIGGYARPKNRKKERIDRRLDANRTGKRQCVMALRQRGGRILATVVPGETSDAAWDLVKRHVTGPAELRADEAPGYDDLGLLFPMTRNHHRVAYVVEPGASTNQAESFFSRVRRSAHGIHHRIAGRYLDWYVADLAFREDISRKDMRGMTDTLLRIGLRNPISRNMAGYWQGNKPPEVLGWAMQFQPRDGAAG